MDDYLSVAATLPKDAAQATLVGRAWLPGEQGGPAVVAVRGDQLVDLTALVPTVAELVARDDRVELARSGKGRAIGSLAAILANSRHDRRKADTPWLLAPPDLQAIKAAGVTFVRSMVERVIEERARGDAAAADGIRKRIEQAVGGSLKAIKPGSEAAAKVKEHLLAEGLWSAYLEVGIGPDAEIFTKCQPMAAVGHGSLIGLHPRSSWNNPEPEIVLVVAADGRIVGATLGNDVNLRDFEGRSALLLGKAKDNNASASLGPFIRLFDEHFGIDDVRGSVIGLEVRGTDGFVLEGQSSMSEISRDPTELVAHLTGTHQQYPDGSLLYCGTMFAPTKDRYAKGAGFTHAPADLVIIGAEKLGTLANQITTSDKAPPWTFGTGALMRNLASRGLLRS